MITVIYDLPDTLRVGVEDAALATNAPVKKAHRPVLAAGNQQIRLRGMKIDLRKVENTTNDCRFSPRHRKICMKIGHLKISKCRRPHRTVSYQKKIQKNGLTEVEKKSA